MYSLSGIIIFLVAGVLRGAFGFGDALFALPLLTLFMPLKNAVPLMALIEFSLALFLILPNRKHIKVSTCKNLLIASALGIPVGGVLLKYIPSILGQLFLGILIVTFSLLPLIGFRWNLPEKDKFGWPVGFISGVLGGAFNTNGPPVIIYSGFKKWSPEVFMATVQTYFGLTGFFILITHAVAGFWNNEIFKMFSIYLPAAGLGIGLGHKIRKGMDSRKFFKSINIALAIIGCFVTIKALSVYLE